MAAAALFGKRSTRFRHVYGAPAQKENCYDNIRVSGNAHDSMFCAVNRHFLAVVLECAGGGGFTVLPLQRTGRIDHNAPKVCGHSAPVMDIKWNPFNDNIIASAADDATVKLWEIPKTGIRSDLTRWSMDLRAHSRRVAYIEWHPTAENILLSAGFDHQAILWNCEIGAPVLASQAHSDVILSLSWNRDGSLYASTCKDRAARVIDPRSGKAVVTWEPHQGSKTTKIAYLGDTMQLFTTGFSQFAQRQYGLWDMRSLSQGAVKQDNIDSASGALFPFYDHDTRMVYLAGKGDGNIRYFELVNSEPYVHYLSEFQSPHPQRGLGVMPKLGLDTSRCEIFRFYKLHSNRPYCEPISMIAPRKAETFQEDLYPATAADRPALSAIEWIGGSNRDPILVNIREPNLAVNSPPMVTGRPVQLTRQPSSSLVPPQGPSNSKPSTPMNFNPSQQMEIDENSLPQSVRNIRKLVGSQSDAQPKENGHSNGHEQPPVVVPPTAIHVSSSSSSHYHSFNDEAANSNGHHPPPPRNHENGHKLAPGHSEQSILTSSRGSDSVFERGGRRSDQERPPSPVALSLNGDHNGTFKPIPVKQSTEHIAGSKQSIAEKVEPNGIPVSETPRVEVVKPMLQPAEHKGIEMMTLPKQNSVTEEHHTQDTLKEHHDDNHSGSNSNPIQPHPPVGPPVNHHHNVHQIRHDDNNSAFQAVAVANVLPSPTEGPGHHATGAAFRPIVPQRHAAPPLNLALSANEKPVSAGFVVQTAVQSPVSPVNRHAPHQPENSVPTSQKSIQKQPYSNVVLDTQQAPVSTDHNNNGNNGANDFPLASPQFRRGAAGGNAYHPQYQQPQYQGALNQQQQQHPHGGGIVRSPSGRATRPDILDALQEQLSASSRELRASASTNNVSPQTMHPPIVYGKGPTPQAGHLQLGQASATTSGRSSRNMSPAERRIRNRTIASAEGHHAFMPVRDFTSAPSPGYSYASSQRSLSGDDTLDGMTDIELRSQCRRQRDEIRLLRRQCEAKDQVIGRLETELRHLVHQMQQRYGVIGGAGAQALASVGP